MFVAGATFKGMKIDKRHDWRWTPTSNQDVNDSTAASEWTHGISSAVLGITAEHPHHSHYLIRLPPVAGIACTSAQLCHQHLQLVSNTSKCTASLGHTASPGSHQVHAVVTTHRQLLSMLHMHRTTVCSGSHCYSHAFDYK
jgi:hypothetical protein